jgi:hypothetical protein
MNLQLPHFEEDEIMLSGLLSEGRAMVHHSDGYREKYRPHYRIMTKDEWKKISVNISIENKAE